MRGCSDDQPTDQPTNPPAVPLNRLLTRSRCQVKLKAKAERDAADAKYKTATVDGRVEEVSACLGLQGSVPGLVEEVSAPVWTWIIISVPDLRRWAGEGGERRSDRA